MSTGCADIDVYSVVFGCVITLSALVAWLGPNASDRRDNPYQKIQAALFGSELRLKMCRILLPVMGVIFIVSGLGISYPDCWKL